MVYFWCFPRDFKVSNLFNLFGGSLYHIVVTMVMFWLSVVACGYLIHKLLTGPKKMSSFITVIVDNSI